MHKSTVHRILPKVLSGIPISITNSRYYLLYYIIFILALIHFSQYYIIYITGGGASQRVRGPTWVVGIVKVQSKSLAFFLGVWGLGTLDF